MPAGRNPDQTNEEVDELLRGHSAGGDHFVSSSLSQRGVWDADPCIDQATFEGRRAHWNVSCSRMDLADGWVKDGDKLLMWVPMQYRYDIMGGIKLAIGEGTRRTRPEVDVERLFAYSGTQWTGIYDPTAGVDTQHVL